MSEQTLTYELNAGTVIDRSKLNTLPTDEVTAALANAYSKASARVVIVDNPRKFFSIPSLLSALNENDDNLDLLLEHNGVAVTDDELEIVNKFNAIKQRILDHIEASKPPLPPYTFTKVPDGWTVEDNLRIKTNTIRRLTGDYSIGVKAAQGLWEWVAPFWAGNVKRYSLNNHSVRSSGYNRECDAYADRITIGCQVIQRYELEQLALYFNWTFPEVTAEE